MKWFKKWSSATSHGTARHPLNAPGDFYSVYGQCTLCGAPEVEAMGLMGHSNEGCYFIRQPQTAAELEFAINAVAVSCVAAVRYAGTDQAVIQQLHDLGCGSECDFPLVGL
ncbi:MAG: hypothetical protein RLZZ519_3465 [Bacteroidota bacterium]|jgi:hypothetical protein